MRRNKVTAKRHTAAAKQRLARRIRRNRRRPDWMQIVLTGLLFLLGAECVVAAFTSPRLAVRRIEVVGAKSLTEPEIATMLGIQPGSNLFRANLYRARKALQGVPAVKDSNVSRILPDRIAVTLQERSPLFALAVGRRLFAVDREGVVFREIPPNPAGRGPGWPILSIARGEAARLGQVLDPSLIASTVHCLQLARADGLKLWKMRIDAHGDLWLNIQAPGPTSETGSSWTVRMGRLQELGTKFADARQIIKGAPLLAAVATHLDVSCPRRPAYRVAGSIPAPAVP